MFHDELNDMQNRVKSTEQIYVTLKEILISIFVFSFFALQTKDQTELL